MSILLSAYYPEGIVFVADKNATITYATPAGERRHVESTATKVLSWPRHRAIVGFVGLGSLAGYNLDEWMRIFIAGTRDFQDIDSLATELHQRIQSDFSIDFPESADVSKAQFVIHLGGFAMRNSVATPVMYQIWNHAGIDVETGTYPPGERHFRLSEEVQAGFSGWPNPEDYPARVRHRLQKMIDEERFLWFRNGANLGAFHVFTSVIWQALHVIQDAGFAAETQGLGARVAFCKMAIEVFGAYFTHHHYPEDRVVGGGVDVAYIPWPQ